jgi:hypothetical protein
MIMQASNGDLLLITIYDEQTKETTLYDGDAKELCN